MRWIWLAIVAIGCGDNARPAEPAPEDDVVPPDAAEPAVAPTYHRDVAPILTARCTGCHTEGGVGPFTLTSYADASMRSEPIAAFTASRVMPPWPADASGACGTFVDPRWVSDREIATLAAWHAAGAPEGETADARPAWQRLPTAFTSAVELSSSVPYQVRPGPDEYRCFVIDPGLTSDRFITAIAMRLDRADVVHHMQLFAAYNAAGEQTITDREALDPEPGYACDSEGVGSRLRYVGVWAPGDLVRRWPDGTGIKLAAGHRLVMQLHYHNHGSAPVLDQTGLALELADTVANAGRIDSASVPSLYLPPGQSDVTVTADRPTIGVVRGARIHMHGLGTRGRMELVRGGEASCLLDIPRWDFGWQLFYRFTQPIALEPDDQIRVTCSYDTTSRSEPVVWGTATDDEMCIGYTFLTD